MEIVIISFAAFGVAILTFFSGFGLGTILSPIFMIFFPIDLAIALTGVVHFFNNIFKLFLVGKKADLQTLIRFGIPAVIAAFLGSWLLLQMDYSKPWFSYTLFDKVFEVYYSKFILALLLIVFALMDLLPRLKNMHFDKKFLPLGGFLSGFFGGFSGNQGALRSAFLNKAGLSKEAFIATTVILSTFVDFTRLGVYSSRFVEAGVGNHLELVVFATLSGILGSFVGNKLLKKITLYKLQRFVAVFLILISVALGMGIL